MSGTHKHRDLDLEEFRKRLLAERDRLTARHREERAQIIAEGSDASENELGSYSTFDPAENEDTAAILVDEERFQAQDEMTVDLIQQIDNALRRIEDGTYGLDEVTGEPIPIARLRALPWATKTVETAERTRL